MSERRGGALGLSLSLIAPGIGHGVVGHARRGAAWLLAMLASWCVAMLSAVWWPPALLVGMVVAFALTLACAVDAARRPRTTINAKGWLALGLLAFVLFIVGPVASSIVARVFIVEAFKIPSGGMCPTFEIGDHVFVDKTSYRSRSPERGDVLVHMGDSGSGAPAAFIRRVVGVAGDEVRISEGRVTVNGKPAPLTKLGTQGCEGQNLYDEDLGNVHTIALGADSFTEDTKLVVPEGHLFLVGDNRNNSYDSRQTGPVAKSSVTGRAAIIWLSKSRIEWREIH